MRFLTHALLLLLALGVNRIGHAQDEAKSTLPETPAIEDQPAESAKPKPAEPSATDQLKDAAKKLEAKAEDYAKEVDKMPQAKSAAAGILQPIYLVAEKLAFPAFHWLAFALMTAGVFSYAFQLVLGKFIVLLRMGFSLKEMASDAVGLAISVVGLVLTTQAAAENSTFTQSPAAVISATLVGGVVGIILYFWGQAQELEAVAGRSRPVKK